MSVPDHPLVNAVQPLLDAIGASLVAPTGITPSDIPIEWDGNVIAGVRLRAVEDVADVMGVSRITVYNYLNAMHR
ncbi:MAG: hypothetical protein NTZ76_06340 [Actinobacteria bacterium]|nr:hypothetical protein [Actinomycetota bacterium]